MTVRSVVIFGTIVRAGTVKHASTFTTGGCQRKKTAKARAIRGMLARGEVPLDPVEQQVVEEGTTDGPKEQEVVMSGVEVPLDLVVQGEVAVTVLITVTVVEKEVAGGVVEKAVVAASVAVTVVMAVVVAAGVAVGLIREATGEARVRGEVRVRD